MSSAYIPPTVEEGPREDKSERGDQKGKEDLDYEVERAKQESAHQKASEKASLGAKTRQKNAPSAANAQRGKPPSNPHIHDGAEKSDASIRFKDAVGRKFTFPYELVKTWSGMEGVIKEAFVHVDLIGPYVQQGRYDIIGPDGEIILPSLWEYCVKPGWYVHMSMWPMDELPPPQVDTRFPGQAIPPGMFPRRGGPHAAQPMPPGFPPSPPPPLLRKPDFKGPSRSSVPPTYTNSHFVPPPAPGGAMPASGLSPEIIDVEPAPARERKAKQNVLLSWMAGGKTPKKKRKHPKLYADAPLSSGGGSPPPTLTPNLAMIPQRGARRSTLANEMISNHPMPPKPTDQSLNLRPKHKHAISIRSALSTSPSSTSSDTSSVRSWSSVSCTGAMNLEDARRLISQRGLIVTCAVSSRPLRRPTTTHVVKAASTPPDLLELSAARIYRDGFEKMAFTSLELVKQRAKRGPPSKEQGQTGAGTMAWEHVKRPVMNLREFEDIARYYFGADDAVRSAVDQLFVSIRKKKLDDEWCIRPGTVLRCDTKPGEKVPASVIFVSVPYLYADSFKSAAKKYQGSENCLPRRLHEALSQLGSTEQDKKQYFHQNEGRGKGQVLWIGQTWILLSASNLLTYGTVPRETLEGDSIAIRGQQSNNEKEDRVIQIMDEDRRLFYLPADKCKSFYELKTSVRDKMNGPEHDLTHCDLNFSLPNDEVLNASRWSSLLKLGDIPTLKVTISFYSDDESDSKSSVASVRSRRSSKSSGTKGGKVKSNTSLDLDDNAKSPQQGVDDAASKASKIFGFEWRHSRQKFVDFAIVEDAAPNLPDDVPKLNSKVPPFFDWKPKAGAGIAQATADRFRERLDEVETDLLQLYKHQHSETSIAIRQVYDAFGTNIYEEAAHNNFVDFSHRRRSHMKDVELSSGPGASSTILSRHAEDFFSIAVPALEAFVVSEFNSSLTLKYFGALLKVATDPTSSVLLRESDDDTEPHETIHSEDKSRQKWVVSRKLIAQADLRCIPGLSIDGAKCPDCERGVIYSNDEKSVSHLRKMHLVGSKTDRVLRDYLLPLPAALTERLGEELCELLVASRNMLASTLRKLLAIQSGVIHDNEFRGSERGIPYYLVDAFKLIVLFVCALPEALHELRWFYHDFDYNAQDLTSKKAQAQRAAMERLGGVTGDLIRKAERTLVSLTGLAEEHNAEHFMTSVGLNYLALQIMSNLLRRPVHNRKKVSELYASYAKSLGSEIQRKPSKRQIPRIGALSNELNLLKDVVELQKDYVESFYVLIMPETLHPLLAKELDREKLFGIESELLSELLDTVKQEDKSLDVTLELCNALKGLTSELTEIMADDQGRAVFVFTVVTVTFLPLSFVASYLSMSGGTDGLGMEWGDVQARFWMVAGPLTVAVAAFCFYIAGRGTLGRLLSGPARYAVTKDEDGGSDDEGYDDDASYYVVSEGSTRRKKRGRSWWAIWRSGGWRRRNHSSSTSGSTSTSSSYILDD